MASSSPSRKVKGVHRCIDQMQNSRKRRGKATPKATNLLYKTVISMLIKTRIPESQGTFKGGANIYNKRRRLTDLIIYIILDN